ncbi:hypothetical protein OBBRIDRAFT_767998 [Obba rivulosa]|uniref:Mini-chromosome maintenance complex-binding protein n=1 Tax=Obba rivulosa TaxID=1052685 RepID=A0A8E2DTB7_9APHY|nr:hypothetical protein OBBRIDRAFT_767998 [Obba rivulosa]
MVSALRVDALRDPTAALLQLFNESDGGRVENFPRLVSEHFSHIFRTLEAFQEIPTLDVRNPPNTFPDRGLVRFRAMVQDTSPSSEMYLATLGSGRCGGWGIEESRDDQDGLNYEDLRECTTLWAVNVPGESAWCADELDGPTNRQERPARPAPTDAYKPAMPHKYPHPTDQHVGVQVKIYDTDGSEPFKATDVVTFVGILTTEAFGSGLETPVDVPTLHMLFSRPHSESIVTRPFPAARQDRAGASGSTDKAIADSEASDPAKTREALIAWIADEALGGDRETAEWVLLTCVARVQSRNPPLFPPSVTLTRFPPPPPVPSTSTSQAAPLPTLSAVLSLLLPLSHTLPLSLASLNKDLCAPESRDEDLHSGALQLPAGTVLLVCEGGVREGQLFERGLLNVRVLQDVMSSQTLSYVFPFSQFAFPTDIGCIVLSEGTKSAFFKTDISAALNAGTDPASVAALYKPADSIKMPPPAQLAAFRDLVVGARFGKVQVTQEVSEYIQSDFVRERQQDKSMTSDDLIRRMTVAKLFALSHHKPDLTVDLWERTKVLDRQRLARLS